jgi:hypothetical protein
VGGKRKKKKKKKKKERSIQSSGKGISCSMDSCDAQVRDESPKSRHTIVLLLLLDG